MEAFSCGYNFGAFFKSKIVLMLANGTDFKDLFEQYWEPLYTYAYAILQDHDDVQDIVQELFVQLWKNKHQIVINSSVEAYMFRSVKNNIYSYLRSNTRRSHHYEQIVKNLDSVEQVERYIEKKEARAILRQKVNHLPEKMKKVVQLYLYDGLSVREIAALLSLSEQTVRNQINLATKKLREELQHVDTSLLILLIPLYLTLSNC